MLLSELLLASSFARFICAIDILADAVNLLLAIELPRHPKTVLNLCKIEGGESHGLWATKASLGAEIRSESPEVLSRVEGDVNERFGTGAQRHLAFRRPLPRP